MKLARFDNWLVKFIAFVIVIGGLWWMTFAVRWHYHTRATDWEYLPFVVSGLAIIFSLAILSKAATAAAAAVILPFVEQLRLGRRSTDPVVAALAKPAAAVVVPVPADTTGTPFDEEEGK